MFPVYEQHLTVFFDDASCGLKNLDKRMLTYNLREVTCMDCLAVARKEAIETQKALDTLPHCPHCGERVENVTLTFNVTKVFRFGIETERDFETRTVKPMIYGSEHDVLDTELVYDKEWQVSCENGHEWFTKRIEPIENGSQWFVKEGVKDDNEVTYLCPICGCDPSEHNWEAHTAEMRASSDY